MTEHASVIRATGRLDSSNCAALERDLLQRLEQGDTLLVLDLSKLIFIGSAGLRTILLVAKQLKAAGGRLALCSLQKPVKEVFELTRVDTLIDVFHSYEDAVAHLTMR
jgi:stage II sporulation protein AA (anti-sigma F factor antagonist)